MILVLVAALLSAQASTVTGNWDVDLGSPGGQVMFRVALKVEGDKLTATFVGGNNNGKPLGAQLDGNTVTLTFNTPPEFGEILITMKGAVDGDVIKGMADYAGFGEYEWSAKRVQ
jgi:hypothetical protein